MEKRGFGTRIIESKFVEGTKRSDDGPGLALIGVDNLAARRTAANSNFGLVLDGPRRHAPRDAPVPEEHKKVGGQRCRSTSMVGSKWIVDTLKGAGATADQTKGAERCHARMSQGALQARLAARAVRGHFWQDRHEHSLVVQAPDLGQR